METDWTEIEREFYNEFCEETTYKNVTQKHLTLDAAVNPQIIIKWFKNQINPPKQDKP